MAFGPVNRQSCCRLRRIALAHAVPAGTHHHPSMPPIGSRIRRPENGFLSAFPARSISRITGGVDPRCRVEPRMRRNRPGVGWIGTVTARPAGRSSRLQLAVSPWSSSRPVKLFPVTHAFPPDQSAIQRIRRAIVHDVPSGRSMTVWPDFSYGLVSSSDTSRSSPRWIMELIAHDFSTL